MAPRDALGLAQLDQTVEFSYASVLGAILYFEGKQLAAHFGDESHFPVFFATPVREAHGLRAVAGNRCLNTAVSVATPSAAASSRMALPSSITAGAMAASAR